MVTPLKKDFRYVEQNAEKVADYLDEISGIDEQNIIYIDESGIDNYLCRERGYSQAGHIIPGRRPGRKFARKSIVAGQRDKEVLAPMVYDGTMDSTMFEQWFATWMIPSSSEGDVFVMDNAAFHRKDVLRALCETHNRKVVFLPPYSPDLNPIEKLWARIKKLLCGVTHLFDTLDEAIEFIFNLKLDSDPEYRKYIRTKASPLNRWWDRDNHHPIYRQRSWKEKKCRKQWESNLPRHHQ